MAVTCRRSGAPLSQASLLSPLVGLAESFTSSDPGEGSSRSPKRSPRSFAYEGAVGLGIVAAMNEERGTATGECGSATVARTPRTAVAPRSEPIPIVCAGPTGVPRKQLWSEEEDVELSESYTCVVYHVGGDTVRRKVYLDDDGAGDCWGSWCGLFSGSPPPARGPAPFPVADFLSRCFRCSKRLHGLDIFMYRGDKAFCSEECRSQQMITDEHRERRASDAPKKPFDCSVSPPSTPLLLATGVAAA